MIMSCTQTTAPNQLAAKLTRGSIISEVLLRFTVTWFALPHRQPEIATSPTVQDSLPVEAEHAEHAEPVAQASEPHITDDDEPIELQQELPPHDITPPASHELESTTVASPQPSTDDIPRDNATES